MEMLEQIADAFVPILCLLITAGGGYLVDSCAARLSRSRKNWTTKPLQSTLIWQRTPWSRP